MIRLEQIKLHVSHSVKDLEHRICKVLHLPNDSSAFSYRIAHRSLDARKKPDLYYVYTIDVYLDTALEKKVLQKNKDKRIRLQEDLKYEIPACGFHKLSHRPVVIGFGPAGLFCAYLLALRGLCPIVLERGEDTDQRSRKVAAFWDGTAKLDPESNVQFGEGGAGAFSDGKLNTSVNDKQLRNRFVLETFVSFGADEELAYTAKPHLGTDVLRLVVKNMRNRIIELGGSVCFGMKVTDLDVKGDILQGVILKANQQPAHPELFQQLSDTTYRLDTTVAVLCIGHSARDTFRMLKEKEIPMEQKSFAVGLRMEHLQEQIDMAQYGRTDAKIGAADYKVTTHCANGRSVYSFCMCPGGYVVNASSEERRLAVNGMSYSGRDSGNANAALIVPVGPADFASEDVLFGMHFQEKLEACAFRLGQGNIPVQRFADFEQNRITENFGHIRPHVKGSVSFANLRELFADDINEALIEAVHTFAGQIKGFDDPDAIFAGVESRTSSPVRILRDQDLQSRIRGLFPCGEGAGYAGGIMSAAMDGMRVAEFLISLYDGICQTQ